MNDKESRYLSIGCVAFCSVAVPMMIAFLLNAQYQSETMKELESDVGQLSKRAILAPPAERPRTKQQQRGQTPLRRDIESVPVSAQSVPVPASIPVPAESVPFHTLVGGVPAMESISAHAVLESVPVMESVPAHAVGDELADSTIESQIIDIEILEERKAAGFEVKVRISNLTPTHLKMLSLDVHFYGDQHNYLGSSEASCFYLESGESKTVTAFNYESFAPEIVDFQFKLSKVVAQDSGDMSSFRLKVTQGMPLPQG